MGVRRASLLNRRLGGARRTKSQGDLASCVADKSAEDARHANSQKYTTGLLGHIFGEMISPTTTLDIASRKRAREEPAPSEKAVRAHSPEQCMGEVLRCGRITLNVGGTCFETTSTTLAGSSAYFRRMLDHGWREATDREIFVDRDPEPFAVLLSSMRSGSVLLPAHDLHLCARAMQQAMVYAAVANGWSCVKTQSRAGWRLPHALGADQGASPVPVAL